MPRLRLDLLLSFTTSPSDLATDVKLQTARTSIIAVNRIFRRVLIGFENCLACLGNVAPGEHSLSGTSCASHRSFEKPPDVASKTLRLALTSISAEASKIIHVFHSFPHRCFESTLPAKLRPKIFFSQHAASTKMDGKTTTSQQCANTSAATKLPSTTALSS
jgi:hypothetical protein